MTTITTGWFVHPTLTLADATPYTVIAEYRSHKRTRDGAPYVEVMPYTKKALVSRYKRGHDVPVSFLQGLQEPTVLPIDDLDAWFGKSVFSEEIPAA